MSEADTEPATATTGRPTGEEVQEETMTIASPSFKPKEPKFGGLIQTGKDTWAVWTGGKPNKDWTELEDVKPKTIQPNQYRAASISSQAKSQAYRRQGLVIKFTRKMNLQMFQYEVLEHLEDCGMDTVTYIQDPTNKDRVVSIITDHGKFTLNEGSIKGDETALVYYDEYAHSDMKDAKKFIYNSCCEDLKKQLNENCPKECSFVTYWLELIHTMQSVSMERFDSMKDRVKSRKITDYDGENVELIVTDYLADWDQLHSASMYDHNLTLNMLNTILSAGGADNEGFKFPLRSIKIKLEDKLLQVRHLSYEDSCKTMSESKLDVRNVLKAAKDKYRIELDHNRWPAASHAKDSKAMSKNYGSVNTLVQTVAPKGKSDGGCNNCGAQGHWKRDCPLLKKKNKFPTGRSGSRFKATRNNSNRNSSSRNTSNNGSNKTDLGLKIPPKRGEAEIKFFDDNKKRGIGAPSVAGGQSPTAPTTTSQTKS